MPFTPAHIAAILPLASSARLRKTFDPWALALGAMIPDLPVLTPTPFLDYQQWHSLRGILTHDVVAVVILLGLLRQVLWEPLVALLPPALAVRAADLRPAFDPLPVVAGAIGGALTHVLWDSFTHEHGMRIWGWAWLDLPVAGPVRTFVLLQYVSSVVGLAIVLWWSRRGLLRLAEPSPPGRLQLSARARLAALTACAAGVVTGGLLWPLVSEPQPGSGLRALLSKSGAGTLIGLAVVLTGYALLWRWQDAKRAGERH